MPEDKEFPTGLFVNPPRSNAPDFVKGRISIRVADFLEYLGEKDSGSWLRIDIKESFKVDEETGLKKWYSQVDNWKPQPKKQGADGLPF